MSKISRSSKHWKCHVRPRTISNCFLRHRYELERYPRARKKMPLREQPSTRILNTTKSARVFPHRLLNSVTLNIPDKSWSHEVHYVPIREKLFMTQSTYQKKYELICLKNFLVERKTTIQNSSLTRPSITYAAIVYFLVYTKNLCLKK